MSRLPIRWKVTLAFAAALAVVLAVVGTALYLRFAADLERTLDRGLQARAGELTALVERSPEQLAPADAPSLPTDESVAQVLRADGTVLAGTSQGRRPLLSPGQLRRALARPTFVDRPGDATLDEAVRILAVPVRSGGDAFVAVAAASRDEQEEALASLLTLELIGIALALLGASVAGYVVSGIALRPVDAMRRRAEEITDQPDLRLPVPAVDDELGRLGATLNAMLARLDAAMAKERRFVADASHELRTPLTVLKSEIEVALLGNRTPAELEAALESAREETDRLIRLAEDLLVLAQADDGRLPIRPAPIDVAELLETVAARHRRRAAADGRAVVVKAPPITCTADRMRLEQALTNLTDNALRHGTGDIELSATEDDGALRIAVRDHGPGFAADLGDRAFERFSRAGAARAGGGAGLGLAIVEAVATAHGGTAGARSTDGGTVVELRLPAHRPLMEVRA